MTETESINTQDIVRASIDQQLSFNKGFVLNKQELEILNEKNKTNDGANFLKDSQSPNCTESNQKFSTQFDMPSKCSSIFSVSNISDESKMTEMNINFQPKSQSNKENNHWIDKDLSNPNCINKVLTNTNDNLLICWLFLVFFFFFLLSRLSVNLY
jgi:hypothetical protein